MMVLDGWSPVGMVGYLLLHAGPIHLIGNMLFLWIFGNAVCAKIGNGPYLAAYVGLGVVAGVIHMLFSGHPVIGASGAINGIVGMYLMLYPLNDISCFYLILFKPGVFSISSYWMILFWLAFDILGIAIGGGMTAYWAHIGGFAGGIALAALALSTKGWVQPTETEKTLPQAMGWRMCTPEAAKAAKASRPAQQRGGKAAPASPPPPQPPLTHATASPAPAASAPPASPPPIDLEPSPSVIHFQCDHCGKTLKVAPEHAGKRGRCSRCSKHVMVPSA